MKNFRTYDLAVEFYEQAINLTLPRHLKDQFQRAGASIVLNLAEGRGKRTRGDQRRFFQIAFGSLRECQAVLDLSGQRDSSLGDCADKLAAHLYRLIERS